MKDFAVSSNLLKVSKYLPNSLFKKRFNCVFWHPRLFILLKRVVINFWNFCLEEIVARCKISHLTAAQKILVVLLLSWYGILTMEEWYVYLLSCSLVSNSLYSMLISKPRNEAFRFEVYLAIISGGSDPIGMPIVWWNVTLPTVKKHWSSR